VERRALLLRPWRFHRRCGLGEGCRDRGGLDANLWRNVGVLRHYGVARGYDGAACTARGVASPCFVPSAPVSYVETVDF
jgi:hypothetical protein